jgi:chromosome segregation ATPase
MPIVELSDEASGLAEAAKPAASEAAASSTTAAAASLTALMSEAQSENPVHELKDLKEKAAQLRKEKKELARRLRNAERKQKRLKEKAKLLSDQDLLSVIIMRRDKKARLAEPPAADLSAAPSSAPNIGDFRAGDSRETTTMPGSNNELGP